MILLRAVPPCLCTRGRTHLSRGCPKAFSGRQPPRTSKSSRQQCPAHWPKTRLCSVGESDLIPADKPLVAVGGDLVTLHFVCKTPQGEVLESTREKGEPLTFELGAGEVVGNALFQSFDAAVRGLAVGDKVEIEASGGDWNPDLLFRAPRDHPEVERLEGRYKNQGGLQLNMLVELANGALAMVVELTEQEVHLDANNMAAGKTVMFELEMMNIERGH